MNLYKIEIKVGGIEPGTSSMHVIAISMNRAINLAVERHARNKSEEQIRVSRAELVEQNVIVEGANEQTT